AAPYKPKDWRKMTGFAVGGPIVKDQVFFFLTYDWYKRNFPGTTIPSSVNYFTAQPCCSTSPAATLLSGATAANISNLAQRIYGDNTPATQAQATALFNQDFGELVAGTAGPVPRYGQQTILFPKLDWQIDTKNHFSIEVDRMRWASPGGIQTQAT